MVPFGQGQRGRRPRRVGLLSTVSNARPSPGNRHFPYRVGERVAGGLVVTGHLASGRIGDLYQVWSVDEWCAFTCKMLSPGHLADRRAAAALRREGRILTGLHHPNIVRCFGGGEHDGLPYLLLEYLQGPSLFDLIESLPDRRMPIADAVRAVIHAGAGLHHLHRHGFLHLDLKPANLLLQDGMPVLVDFDVARRLLPARRPARALGTIPYMAPEQVLQRPPTAAADVYGLAAVLYELITGRWPFHDVFTGQDPRTGSERKYPQTGAPPPPSPSQFCPELSTSLERLILRGLAQDPQDRFPAIAPFLAALAAELEGTAALWP
jgi:eukaryotic-like serine/threonine-protein kinase